MKKILFISFLLLSGCALKPVHILISPRISEREILKKQLDESSKIANLYIESLYLEHTNEASKACFNFQDLSLRSDFPLKDLAFIHTIKNCILSNRELSRIWESYTPPKYGYESYYKISLSMAKERNLKSEEARFSFLLADYLKSSKEKSELLINAVNIAKDSNDQKPYDLYLKKLIEVAPRFETNITEKNIYIVAKDFEQARNFEKARELYYQHLKSEDITLEELVKTYNSIKLSYKTERKLDLFLEKSIEMEKFLFEIKDEQLQNQKLVDAWVDSKIALARAYWTENKTEVAQKLINEIINSKFNISENHKGICFHLLGSMLVEQKKFTEAQINFSKALTFKMNEQTQIENTQWALIWSYYLNKEYSKAEKKMEIFYSKTSNPALVARLKFWRAILLQKLNRADEAKTIFADILKTDQFNYYGLWSASYLNQELIPLTATPRKIDSTGDNTLDWLIVVGDYKFAQPYLKEIESRFKTFEQREKSLPIYLLSKWYQGGIRQSANFPTSWKQRIYSEYHYLIYPKANEGIATTLAAKYNIPVELVWAITRQESNFNEYARSPVDAFGLMQLTPEKASELASKYGINYREISDLYIPEINIELGTALLSELISKYKSKFINVTAAYNASESAIATWERDRFTGDYLAFVESIPYEETRNYVKAIFTNYFVYKRSTESNPIIIDKDFYKLPFH